MSRVFKGKEKPDGGSKVKGKGGGQEKAETCVGEAEKKTARSKAARAKDEGVTLVDATPAKPKRASKSQCGTRGSQGGSLFELGAIGEEEIWNLPSSPDVLYLGAKNG
jgi:hypothetical protein